MNLLEHQGKTLFRRYGLAVPVGVLWPQPLPISAGGYVAKAQIRAGGRGKAGGIRFAENGETAGSAAAALAKAEIGGRRVEAVLVEERLAIAREFYVAVAIDRDRRCRSFVLAAQGGVEIESLPADRVRRVPVDPLIGLRPHHLRRAVAALEPADKAVAGALSAALEALYRAFIGHRKFTIGTGTFRSRARRPESLPPAFETQESRISGQRRKAINSHASVNLHDGSRTHEVPSNLATSI